MPSVRDAQTLLGFTPARKASIMTLGMSLRGEDFVLLAADKQQSVTSDAFGNYTQNVTKLIEVSDSCIFAMAGSTEGEDMFRAAFDEAIKGKYISGGTLWRLGENLRTRFQTLYPEKAEREYKSMSFLLVGIDATDKDLTTAQFNSPNFTARYNEPFSVVGSGAHSHYFINHIYRSAHPQKPSREQLILLACFCINETAKQDRLVGTEMDIWIVRDNLRVEKLLRDKITEVRNRAERIATSITQLFLI